MPQLILFHLRVIFDPEVFSDTEKPPLIGIGGGFEEMVFSLQETLCCSMA